MIKFTGSLCNTTLTHICLYFYCWTLILLMKNVLFFTATGLETANPLLWEGRWDECLFAKIKDTLSEKECCNQLKLCSGPKAERMVLSCCCSSMMNMLSVNRGTSEMYSPAETQHITFTTLHNPFIL